MTAPHPCSTLFVLHAALFPILHDETASHRTCGHASSCQALEDQPGAPTC